MTPGPLRTLFVSFSEAANTLRADRWNHTDTAHQLEASDLKLTRLLDGNVKLELPDDVIIAESFLDGAQIIISARDAAA